MANRRSFLQSALGLGAGLFTSSKVFAESRAGASGTPKPAAGPAFNVPVVTTDVGDLPFLMDGDVKVFHLIAQVIEQRIAPDKTIAVWGFNGSAPGPTIQVTQGDRVRVIFDNQLPEPSSIHWHGFEDQIQYDGQPGISQDAVKPGGRFVYEFTIHQEGTYFYHSHMAMQEMAGMLGAFIMHPRVPYRPHCDKDFVLHLQEYAVLPSNIVPNTMNMEYNWLLLNGKAGPASTPLIVRQGDRVRIRFINLGMDHHPMHMHGHTFHITGTEGGRIPEAGWWPGNTVLVGVAQARAVEFVANNPGDWMVHCHLPHHMMNEMSSTVGKMTRTGRDMPSGVDMNTGMGMLQGTPGAPMGEDYGTSLGRGMGFGSDSDLATTNGPLSRPKAGDARAGMTMSGMPMADMQPDVAANAGNVPNFPQDAYMEGPMMRMDATVAKPENYGLRPGWSQYMQGMMTFVRVLPPELYDQVVGRMKQAARPNDPYASVLAGVKNVLVLLALVLAGAVARGQAMPGMDMSKPMPAPAAKRPSQHAQPAPQASPAPAAAQPGSMPGMDMGGMTGVQQGGSGQDMPTDGIKMSIPAPGQAVPAAVHNTLGLQEPEDPSRKTGETLPAPDLLAGVAARKALSLAEFLQAADAHNPTLAQARELVRRSAAEARQATLYPNPTVGYQGEQIRGGSYGGGEQGGFVAQTIVLGGKLRLRRDVYEQQRLAEMAGVEEQTARVHNDVTAAFYTALTSQAKVVLRQRLLGLAADAVDTVHQLANVGQADAPDILQAEVESEQAKIDYAMAQRMFLQDFHLLATVAGQPALTVSPLAGELGNTPVLDAEQQVAAIAAASPAVRRSEQEVLVNEARLRSVKRDPVPDLQLKAGEQYNGEQLNATPAHAAGPQSFATVGVDLPLWNHNQGASEAARADVERARQEVVRARLVAAQTAEPLAQAYLAARFAAERYKTQLIPRAQRAYSLYLAKYNGMAGAYPQVLVSQRTLFQLQMSYLSTLHEVWVNAVALQNFGLHGGLDAPRASDSGSAKSMRGVTASSSAAD